MVGKSGSSRRECLSATLILAINSPIPNGFVRYTSAQTSSAAILSFSLSRADNTRINVSQTNSHVPMLCARLRKLIDNLGLFTHRYPGPIVPDVHADDLRMYIRRDDDFGGAFGVQSDVFKDVGKYFLDQLSIDI